MLKGAASKIAWVARATTTVVGLAIILALLFGATTAAFAGSGIGGVFNLGRQNTVDRQSALVGETGNPNLRIFNQGAAPGLSLRVGDQQTPPAQKTVAPMKVDSQGKVANLNADKVDGLSSDQLRGQQGPPGPQGEQGEQGEQGPPGEPRYTRTVVVSPQDGASPQQNGAALVEALSEITGATAGNPYLLHIEPGTYDLGDGSLTMKPFVDVEGSGELNTVITSAVTAEGCFVNGRATVNGADGAEMGSLTVRNTGADGFKTAISVDDASLRLTHLTAQTTADGGLSNFALCVSDSDLTMADVTVAASGQTEVVNYGVFGDASEITVERSKLTGIGGFFPPSSGALRIQRGASADVALTQIVGGVQGETGTGAVVRCAGVYDENFAFFAGTCP